MQQVARSGQRADSERLSTWIHRIAARGAGRTVQGRPLQSLVSTMLMREPPTPPAADPSERTARLQLLDELIKRLSPKKRLVLLNIEERPVEDIAKIAGCPDGG
jgi:DNA-directed RNA polymerase specialized sigma24 family protein